MCVSTRYTNGSTNVAAQGKRDSVCGQEGGFSTTRATLEGIKISIMCEKMRSNKIEWVGA